MIVISPMYLTTGQFLSFVFSLRCYMESIVYSKIFSFIQPLIRHQQFGFVEERSTLNQCLKFLANIYHHADNKHCTGIIYFGFKKAFDTFPHNVLLYKLWMLGITGLLWHWFKNYLFNRNHFCFHREHVFFFACNFRSSSGKCPCPIVGQGQNLQLYM